MKIFNIVMDSLSTLISIGTFILVLIGLNTWRKQLKGENTYKLSLDVLRELKLTLVAIDEYRYVFYPADEMYYAFKKYNNDKIPDFMNGSDKKTAYKCAEIERWNKIIEQFNIYTGCMLKLAVSINNYEIDLVNGKRLKDYLIEISRNRSKKEFADDEREELQFMNKDERNRLKDEYLEINKILSKRGKDEDIFGQIVDQYFEEINRRLRKYIK